MNVGFGYLARSAVKGIPLDMNVNRLLFLVLINIFPRNGEKLTNRMDFSAG